MKIVLKTTAVKATARRIIASPLIGVSLTLPFSGCAGTTHLTSQLKTAQHERDVLRDAYEAQQLRLRELELRLLKLEDRQVMGARDAHSDSRAASSNRDTYTTPSRPSRLNSTQMTSSTSKQDERSRRLTPNDGQPEAWRTRRLRALPVVRVSASQALSASGDFEREPQERGHRSVDTHVERPRRVRRSTSRSASRPVRSTSRKRDQEIPTLTSRKSRQERAPDSHPSPPQRRDARPPHLAHADEHVHHQPPGTSRTLHAQSSTHQSPSQSAPQKTPRADLVETYQRQISGATSASERAPLLIKLAKELRRRGQTGEAMRLMKRLISESPTHSVVPDALYLMGRLHIERGAEAQGRATLLRLSRLYPNARAAQSARQFLQGGAQ